LGSSADLGHPSRATGSRHATTPLGIDHLVEDVLSLARVLGVGSVQVTANLHAMAFYKSVGFVSDGMAQTPFGPALRMRLDAAGSRQ